MRRRFVIAAAAFAFGIGAADAADLPNAKGVHVTDNRVEAGFSYKFDLFAPSMPVVAKY